MRLKPHYLCAPLLLTLPVWAQGPWLPDDGMEDRITLVNEGQLAFLPKPPAHRIHQHHNEITVSAQSLNDGWVQLRQCHSHLDPVAATQIVYHPERIRGLRVLSSQNLGSSWVEGSSVQLQEIDKNARICIQAESRALQQLDKNRFQLRNGPYMRRFLDGYYPLQVTLDIHYPGALLELTGFSPSPQPGLEITQTSDSIHLEGWFEGKLFTQFDFYRHENH